MPITRTVTATRPNTSVNFWPEVQHSSIWKYITETYIDTGKVIWNTTSLSDDGLTRTSVKVFDTEQSLDQYISDDTIHSSRFVQGRELYNSDQGIVIDVVDQST